MNPETPDIPDRERDQEERERNERELERTLSLQEQRLDRSPEAGKDNHLPGASPPKPDRD